MRLELPDLAGAGVAVGSQFKLRLEELLHLAICKLKRLLPLLHTHSHFRYFALLLASRPTSKSQLGLF